MSTPLQDMRQLLKDDDRFKVEAYQFIREALQFAAENVASSPDMVSHAGSGSVGHADAIDENDDLDVDDSATRTRHVTGGQLCHACRQYAVEQYGFLAGMVLSSWGVHSTSDLGDLVYNLIRIGQMRKSESDRREDFDNVFDFENAFEPEFEMAPLGE